MSKKRIVIIVICCFFLLGIIANLNRDPNSDTTPKVVHDIKKTKGEDLIKIFADYTKLEYKKSKNNVTDITSYTIFDPESYTVVIKVDKKDIVTNIELDINKESDNIEFFKLANNLFVPDTTQYNTYNEWLTANFKKDATTDISDYHFFMGYNETTFENTLFIDKEGYKIGQ